MSLAGAAPLVLVGAGKMGGAMLAGWLARGLDPTGVVIVDPSPPQGDPGLILVVATLVPGQELRLERLLGQRVDDIVTARQALVPVVVALRLACRGTGVFELRGGLLDCQRGHRE